MDMDMHLHMMYIKNIGLQLDKDVLVRNSTATIHGIMFSTRLAKAEV